MKMHLWRTFARGTRIWHQKWCRSPEWQVRAQNAKFVAGGKSLDRGDPYNAKLYIPTCVDLFWIFVQKFAPLGATCHRKRHPMF